jgi:hypothetical protein
MLSPATILRAGPAPLTLVSFGGYLSHRSDVRRRARVIEVAFIAGSQAAASTLTSYRDIPEAAYVDLLWCPSVDSLRELARLLGCDERQAFQTIQTVPQERARVLAAGREFEQALLTHTIDELHRAALAWGRTSEWAALEPNAMDLMGTVSMLAAQWTVAVDDAPAELSLLAWVSPAAEPGVAAGSGPG